LRDTIGHHPARMPYAIRVVKKQLRGGPNKAA
jgi:hypothetical protein